MQECGTKWGAFTLMPFFFVSYGGNGAKGVRWLLGGITWR